VSVPRTRRARLSLHDIAVVLLLYSAKLAGMLNKLAIVAVQVQ